MQADEREYSIEELAAVADVPVRTIRFYIGRGLLPGPGGRGKAAAYGEEQLVRLQLIRLLGERRVPLDEIGQRLVGLDAAEVRELLDEEQSRQSELQQAAALSPKEYVAALLRRAGAPPPTSSPSAPPRPSPDPSGRPPGAAPSQRPPAQPPRPPAAPPVAEARSGDAWQRWEIAPGLELHARADAAGRYRALIARLLRLGSEGN